MLAEKCILSGLKAAGVVTGDIEEMLEKRIGALFMPHGLCQSTECMLVSQLESQVFAHACCIFNTQAFLFTVASHARVTAWMWQALGTCWA